MKCNCCRYQNFFGNKQLIDNALPMKSSVEALQLRYKLLQNSYGNYYFDTDNNAHILRHYQHHYNMSLYRQLI